MAIKRKAIGLAINGAEYIELDTRSREVSLTMPAYVRTRCGLEPWIARAREMQGRAQPASRTRVLALDRVAMMIWVSHDEYASLDAQARLPDGPGLSIPQFVRTRCGFAVRQTSLPNTDGRDREEDDAWERLQRLGLNPKDYFPPED